MDNYAIAAPDPKKLKKYSIWMGVFAAVAVVGIVLVVFSIVTLFGSMKRDGVYLDAAGMGELAIEKEDKYSIYYEYIGTASLTQRVSFTFEDKATGEVYQSEPPTMGSTYFVYNVNGVCIGDVELPAGHYTVTSNADEDHVGMDYILSKEPLSGLFRSVILSFLGTGILAIGVIGFFVALEKRNKEKKVGAPPPPYDTPPWQPPQPPYYPGSQPQPWQPPYAPGGQYHPPYGPAQQQPPAVPPPAAPPPPEDGPPRP